LVESAGGWRRPPKEGAMHLRRVRSDYNSGDFANFKL